MRYPRVLVTPNVLAEALNLLSQHREPQRWRIIGMLGWLISDSQEVYVVSADACQNKDFCRLGLSDAALLESVSADKPLLTVDFDLYLAALEKDVDAGVNFQHLRPK